LNTTNQSDRSAIKINNQIFLNYYGLEKTDLSDELLTRSFNHLISLASRGEIETYLFVSGPLTVHFSYMQFRKLGLINKISFLRIAVASVFSFIAEVITTKKAFNPWDYFSYFGFFRLSRPSLQSHANFIYAEPDSKSGYVDEELLPRFTNLFLSSEDVVEVKPNIFLLDDKTALGKSLDERMLREIFFKKDDISYALSIQVKDFDKVFKNLKPTELSVKQNPLVDTNILDNDFVSNTNAKIVTAYWYTLTQENPAKFKTEDEITLALINAFGDKSEFRIDFISRRLEKGVMTTGLKIDLSIKTSPYNSTKDAKDSAEAKEIILISALSELLCLEKPDIYETYKSLLRPIDKIYGEKKTIALSTFEKRLGKGRRILGTSRK